MPERNAEIALIARTTRAASEPARVAVLWQGRPTPPAEQQLKPKLYAVAIGVSAYARADLALRYAAQDARDLAAALQRQAGGLYREVEVRLMADAEATRDNILKALEWLEGEVTEPRRGAAVPGRPRGHRRQAALLLPARRRRPGEPAGSAVSHDDIRNTVGALAGKALMFIDACHSARALAASDGRRGAADITRWSTSLPTRRTGW